MRVTAPPSRRAVSRGPKHEAPLPRQFPRDLSGNSGRQGLSHTAHCTERARSTLFTLLFFNSPSLEPSPARLEASVHSSLDLKHCTTSEHSQRTWASALPAAAPGRTSRLCDRCLRHRSGGQTTRKELLPQTGHVQLRLAFALKQLHLSF